MGVLRNQRGESTKWGEGKSATVLSNTRLWRVARLDPRVWHPLTSEIKIGHKIDACSTKTTSRRLMITGGSNPDVNGLHETVITSKSRSRSWCYIKVRSKGNKFGSLSIDNCCSSFINVRIWNIHGVKCINHINPRCIRSIMKPNLFLVVDFDGYFLDAWQPLEKIVGEEIIKTQNSLVEIHVSFWLFSWVS